jgi:hypothetical protein
LRTLCKNRKECGTRKGNVNSQVNRPVISSRFAMLQRGSVKSMRHPPGAELGPGGAVAGGGLGFSIGLAGAPEAAAGGGLIGGLGGIFHGLIKCSL